MSIRRGENWGRPVPHDAPADEVATDADLAALVAPNVDWTEMVVVGPAPQVRLLGGDLHRTLGSPRNRGDGNGARTAVPCDVVLVRGTDAAGAGVRLVAAAHVVGVTPGRLRRRPPLWSTPSLVAANAAFLGPANVGPRAHPGDGLVDLTIGSLGRRDRRRAAARIRTGTHVPHPSLVERRVDEWSAAAGARYHLTVDGRDAGRVSDLRLVVAPDAVTVLL